jgi:hypothetical protein
MSTGTPVPYFPTPPADYDRVYMAQVIRAFAVFAQQVNNPGPLRATTITLTALPVYANNAAALSGGLAVNDVYRTSTGELRIVI